MTFLSPNLIGIYVNNNERFWSFDGTFLNVFSNTNVFTAKYVGVTVDIFGKFHLEGRFLLLNNGWRHYLVEK